MSYDLRSPLKDYTPVFEGIKKNSSAWWHYLTNTWLVATEMDANSFANSLVPYITTDDSLLVMEVRGWGQGWLPVEAWDWIRLHCK